MSKKDKNKGKKKHEDNGVHEDVALAVADEGHNGRRKKKKADKEEKKPEKVSVSFESSIPREEAVSYFETLVTGLKKGTLNLKQESREINLQPPAQLDVKVKASHKREKEKIAFEISWRTPSESELTITSE